MLMIVTLKNVQDDNLKKIDSNILQLETEDGLELTDIEE